MVDEPEEIMRVPDHVEKALEDISEALARYLKIEVADTPFYNSGATFKNDTFEVQAYSWADDDQPYNFKFDDVEITWYKHFRRGAYINVEIEQREASEMARECIDSLVE